MVRLLATSFAVLAAIFGSAVSQAQDLTLDRLHAEPGLDGPSLRAPAISPDGKIVTLLKGRDDDARQLDLWAHDLASGKSSVLVSSTDLLAGPEQLSEEEQNRRERQRIYENGIVAYQWDAAGEALLFPLGGDVYLYNLADKRAVRVTQTDGFETDPKISPLGRYVSYVRDDELYIYDRQKSREKKLTKGAGEFIRNATSEFVAQEELDRDTGYWWSPDETKIAYLQIDESPLSIAERLDFSADGVTTISQRYPFAGTDNVRIKVGVVQPKKRRTKWVDLGANQDIYVADVFWSTNSKVLYITRLSRDQKILDLLAVNPKTGKSRVLLTESSKTWVNLNKSFRALVDGGFIWGSERDGFHHLYRYSADGTLRNKLSKGLQLVNEVSCFNEATGALFVTGWQETPLTRDIFQLSLTRAAAVKIPARGEGRTSAVFAEDCSAYIGSYSSENQPKSVAAYDAKGTRLAWLHENNLDQDHPYFPHLASHQPWQYGQIETEDGAKLDYQLLKPADMKRGEQHPALILVYGGPHAQTVHKGWHKAFNQLLVDQGYVVFLLDNRGAANRGTKFEDPLYRAMGQIEVRDQAIGAKWLAAQGFVDASRIGVYGWSYGGYMSLMMLSQNPELYKAGVAGAPVTDWTLYDTAYTERYMGDPRSDAEAYDKSTVFHYLDGLKGDGELLLIHGMADDNVVFLNSVKLMDALQSSGKRYELMTYPGEKHGFRQKANRLHRDKMILNFFDRKLK